MPLLGHVDVFHVWRRDQQVSVEAAGQTDTSTLRGIGHMIPTEKKTNEIFHSFGYSFISAQLRPMKPSLEKGTSKRGISILSRSQPMDKAWSGGALILISSCTAARRWSSGLFPSCQTMMESLVWSAADPWIR